MFWNGFFFFTILYAIVNGVAMYFVIAYFDRQRASKQIVWMSLAIVAPSVLMLVPLALLPSAVSFQTLPFLSLAAPVAAFLLLWLALKIPVDRAVLFVVAAFVVSLVTRTVLGVTAKLLQPLFGDGVAARSGPPVLLLAAVVVVLVIWIATKTVAGRRLPIVAGCFLFALLLAPVPVVGHGFGIVPAFMVWPIVFGGGSDGAMMLMFAAPAVLLTGTLLVVICRFLQKLRTPAPDADSDR